MKKYVETKSKKPFDWNKTLAKDCKDMKESELEKLRNLSASWVTCACGTQCAIIPRAKKDTHDHNQHEPLDDKLSTLGANFHSEGVHEMAAQLGNYFTTHGDVWANDRKEYLKNANAARLKAIRILKQIEKRSSQLIEAEIIKAKNVLKQFGYTVKK